MIVSSYSRPLDEIKFDVNNDNSNVGDSRKRIDDIDAQLIELLNERASVALEIGRKKREAGIGILSTERESQIMKRIFQAPEGNMPKKALGHIFSEIISACRDLQKPISVAFLGPRTTFSHQVTLRRFGHSTELVAASSILDVFSEVENDRVSFGVVPVENSIEGGVSATMDSFVTSDLKISGEIFASIRHFLMSRENSITDIENVYSHPQALNQCRKWLNGNMRGVNVQDCSSTAEAARKASVERGVAAIASSLAASEFNLNILAENIQDRSDNTTRFLIIGKAECKPTGEDKTSLYFTAKHKSGSLCQALNHFSKRGINLGRIESRPLKERPWEYSFFVDCEGHVQDQNLSDCLAALKNDVEQIKILGSYPRMDPTQGI